MSEGEEGSRNETDRRILGYARGSDTAVEHSEYVFIPQGDFCFILSIDVCMWFIFHVYLSLACVIRKVMETVSLKNKKLSFYLLILYGPWYEVPKVERDTACSYHLVNTVTFNLSVLRILIWKKQSTWECVCFKIKNKTFKNCCLYYLTVFCPLQNTLSHYSLENPILFIWSANKLVLDLLHW